MSFHVGQKVVCVDASIPENALGLLPLVKGRVYTIRGLSQTPCCSRVVVDIGIDSAGRSSLCQACDVQYKSGFEHWFYAHRFRPYLPDLTSSLAMEAQKESMGFPVEKPMESKETTVETIAQ